MELVLLTAAAFALTAAATPLAGWLGHKVDAVSRPDGRRRLQTQSIPQSGGLAICLGLVISLALAGVFQPGAIGFHFAAIACSACLLCGLGLIDDIVELSARVRLPLQLVCFLPTLFTLPLPESWSVIGYEVELGMFVSVLAAFWLLAAANATNLIDGMDGLASGTTALIAGAVGLAATLTGNDQVAAIALLVAGCCSGFLIHNLPPARIYLGDCGSTMIGFLAGVVCWQVAINSNGSINLGMACLLLMLPLMDTSLAIFRRLMLGTSVLSADRAHVHHRLMDSNGSVWKTLLTLLLVTGWGCTLALIAAIPATEVVAWILAAASLTGLAWAKVAGHYEWKLLQGSILNLSSRFSSASSAPDSAELQMSVDADENLDEAIEPVFNKAA